MGSHYLKDEEGNYHEYSDEEYNEMQAQNLRAEIEAIASITILIGTAFITYALKNGVGLSSPPFVIGSIAFILGAILLIFIKREKFVSSLLTLVIVGVLIIFVGSWLWGMLMNKFDGYN